MRKVLVALVSALISLPVLADVTGLVSPPGGSGGSSLPSQTGNSGKFLTTDGTSPSWASPTASASSITPGTTTVVGSTAPCLIDNSATTVMGCLAETGTGSAVLATSPTLVTPNLGTPSAINLTNATALPATALPALAGDVTSSAGSNSVTVSKVNGASVPASASLTGTNSSSQFTSITIGSGLSLSAGTLSNTGGNPTCTLGQLVYYAAGGATVSCLTLGTNLSITSGTLNASSTASTAWSAITAGTNTAALVMGTGGSLTPSGGTIDANQVNGGTVPASASCLGTNSSSQPVSGCTEPVEAAITASTYTLLTTDCGKQLPLENATGVTVTVPGGSTFDGCQVDFTVPHGYGASTLSGSSVTIGANSAVSMAADRQCGINFDGTNWQVIGCNALVATSGSGTVTSVGMSAPAGFSVMGSPVTTSGILALAFSGPVVGGTTFTMSGTGCTPTAATGGATAGTFTLATGPCTAVTITPGLTAPHGWHCNADDETALNAGTWIPAWGEKSSTATTAVLPIPGAAGATDVISFDCTGY